MVELPAYWERLSEEDKMTYAFLRKTLASPNCKNRRNQSQKTFKNILKGLKSFVVRGDAGDRDRMLVCGISWLPNQTIATNTKQLRIILSKCKSSINGSFQSLGYGTVPSGADSATSLIKLFPEFEKNYPELRQWTVRQLFSSTPKPSSLEQLIQANLRAQKYVTPPPNLAIFNEAPKASISNMPQIFNQPVAPPPTALSAPPPTYEEEQMMFEQQALDDKPVQSFDDENQIQSDTEFAFDNDSLSNLFWDNDPVF